MAPCLYFYVGSGDRTQVLLFTGQAFYGLSQFPNTFLSLFWDYSLSLSLKDKDSYLDHDPTDFLCKSWLCKTNVFLLKLVRYILIFSEGWQGILCTWCFSTWGGMLQRVPHKSDISIEGYYGSHGDSLLVVLKLTFIEKYLWHPQLHF